MSRPTHNNHLRIRGTERFSTTNHAKYAKIFSIRFFPSAPISGLYFPLLFVFSVFFVVKSVFAFSLFAYSAYFAVQKQKLGKLKAEMQGPILNHEIRETHEKGIAFWFVYLVYFVVEIFPAKFSPSASI